MTEPWTKDVRLIEAGFPCHQVGAETQRERDTGKAPPTHRLHVWWARRPLTPSRAAVLASLLPADTDPDWFLRQLGIEKRVVEINGQQWTLTGNILKKIEKNASGDEFITVDEAVLGLLEKEDARRGENRTTIGRLKAADPALGKDPVLMRWEEESQPIPRPWPGPGTVLAVKKVAADPFHVNERIAFAKATTVQRILGSSLRWHPEELYSYLRAFEKEPSNINHPKVVLDPTAGGGSIPFEALRLGHQVIANELNPVAAVILHATLEYPFRFGKSLSLDLRRWGEQLLAHVSNYMLDITPFSPIPRQEELSLREHCQNCQEVIPAFLDEYDYNGLLFCREVTCPSCGGEAPLLNTCWLSKEAGKKWAVRIVPDGRPRGGRVRFEAYRVEKGKKLGPDQNPDFATVKRGVGTCIHCRQAIDAEEIKRQARGESPHGKWRDRLYCVVAFRLQPKLDKNGQPLRYKSGDRKGEIKTEKVRFFRPPNEADLQALEKAEQRLRENWDRWDTAGLIPTESFPKGNDMRPALYGMQRWCDMFTPRQLLGHLSLIEELNRLKPEILKALGPERGRAVVTYLQFAIDKGLDYNSRQTRWHYGRGVIINTFGRHDFSLKWTFGEMIFTGPYSGAAWGLNQVIDAYKGIVSLVSDSLNGGDYPSKISPATILCGTAANMSEIEDLTVDLICMDPPYYNNVQYAELSDYFYVWQKRTLADLYPNYFGRRLTDKQNEAVANPERDGGAKNAKLTYERMMAEIFGECRRVLKEDGLLTLMFTHKTQEAWEALTSALIENGWNITAAFPVESETQQGIHTKDTASAISSIFISCRKRTKNSEEPAFWTGIGGRGVAQQIRLAVAEGLEAFAKLKLNPVDEMVASYGRALRVLSQNWPVLDGDTPVGPLRAMNEASRVVAQHQIERITAGRIKVEDLSPEAAMALTLFGVYGLSEFPYDEALNLGRSLNIALEGKAGGYAAEGRIIGINTETGSGKKRSATSRGDSSGFHAPLVRRGAKLRLVRPGERHPKRLENPQTEWDLLQGIVMAYREGDVPVARAYLRRHAEGNDDFFRALLHVWTVEVPDEKLRKEAQALIFGLG